MPSQSGIFVMISIFVLFRSASSYYQEGATENDADDFVELKTDTIGDWKSNNDDAYTSYPESIKQILLKNDPQLFFVTSMHRRPDDMVSVPKNFYRLTSNE